MRTLPTGTVTFLFTDIEGSTRLLSELGEDYADVLAEHRRVLRDAFVHHGGVEVDTQGDAFFVAFTRASDAVAAASEANAELTPGPVRVRMGIHTGEPIVTGEGYVGVDVHRAARVCAAGHGGQVLLTQTTRDLLPGLELRDLGDHRLKDLSEPQRLYQLGSEDFLPLTTLDATNLPVVASSLLDREAEIDELVTLLSDGSRLVTVTGAGGTGKTRLALQVAAELVGAVEDGVFWVPLADLSDPDLVVSTVAQTLGATGDLTTAVRDRDALLLLDNAEHLLDSAAALSELLAAAPRLRLLVTSRAPLRLTGEREYPLEPLADSDAVMLFVERARSVGQEVQANGTVTAICRRLDGLPLAVELAAARTKVLDPTTLLRRLDQALPLLTGGPRDAPERQRTLRGAIEWSHELLEEPARAIFRRLAVFIGGCSLEAAEEVCEADLDTLAALVDLSLLKRTDPGRFIMLETIREYALEQLAASGEAEQLRERHARLFTELVERARLELGGPERASWEARLETELPNIRAALAWASERRPELLHRLARSLRIFWNTHGYLREGRGWLERSLAMGAEGLERAEILGGLGWICRAMGDRVGAAAAAEERLRLAQALGDAKNLSAALGLQAVLAEGREDLALAEELHQASIATSRALGAAGRPERHVGDFAEFLVRHGRYGEAKYLLKECLTTARQRGDTFLVGRSTAVIGALTLIEGRPADALPLLSEGMQVLYGFRERYGTLYCLALLAETFAALGGAETGARLVGAADAQIEETGLALLGILVRRRDATVTDLRAALGDARFATLHAEGAAMSFDEAVEYALHESADA
jgi:predicted ATPase